MKLSMNSSARSEAIKISLLMTLICISIIYSDALWRLDKLIYDFQSSIITRDASKDIVIVAIDETSLNEIGRWPWPRDVHARLIDKLTQYQARAVVIDIIFSESSENSISDQRLSQAIEENGNVILPVLLEQTRLRGQLIETLPLPALSVAASDLGHVHVELDPDGIARSTYLYEGLGEAHWPHIGLSVLNMLQNQKSLSIKRNRASEAVYSRWSWIRENHVLIPYIGPPGSFQTTSYINVLNDEILAESLRDKIVLIGVTAAGLGDSLPTPVSGLTTAMPGIEINANIIQAIQSGTLIKSINPSLLYLFAIPIIFISVMLFSYLTPRKTLILVVTEGLIIFILSVVILRWLHVWVPITAVLLSLLIAYPLWAWRRLEFTVNYLNNEFATLSREANAIEKFVAMETEQPFEQLKDLVPVEGVHIIDEGKKPIISLGKSFLYTHETLMNDKWQPVAEKIFGRKILISDKYFVVLILWTQKEEPDQQQDKIIKTYLRQLIKPEEITPTTTVETIESRITEIQSLTHKLAHLRQIITDSLEQMADGVIVTDSLGTITLINQQANDQLTDHRNEHLLHQSVQPILKNLSISSGESWDHVIDLLLKKKHYENLQVRTLKGKDLIINISPLQGQNNNLTGFIINLSDITEVKHAQRKQNEMLSFLSHDLRSPLVSVLALLEKNKLNSELTPTTHRIEQNINHTIQLAEDFVHLSRIEGEEELKFDNINLSDVIANAIDTVWDQANLKNIRITQAIQTDGWIKGNGSVLERIIVNLLTNAVKYTKDKGMVKVSLDAVDSHIQCCIEDNGSGISELDLPFLFDRFSRVQQHYSKSGIGLGLAFVHAATERHNGSVNVSSVLGEGSKFCLLFPAVF